MDRDFPPARLRHRAGDWIESPAVQNAITALIVFNAATLGLATSATVRQVAGEALAAVEQAVILVFVAEILVKLYAFGPRFFRSGWNVFDFLIVGISILPAAGPFSVLRALRILRVLRLMVKIERLRHIVDALIRALPGIGWIALLLLLVFYVYGVMGTRLFGERFPEDFGHLGAALYSLFQIMTLESWSEAIARPVIDSYPYAWVYFVSFILVTAFTVLNLFIGVIVNTMQERHFQEEESRRSSSEAHAHAEREELLRLVRELHEKLEDMNRRLRLQEAGSEATAGRQLSRDER